MDISHLEFDPDHFHSDKMHEKMQKWIQVHGLPTAIKFYGYHSQLKRLRDRLQHYKAEHGLQITTAMDSSSVAGRRGMVVEISDDRI